ncbi:putative porin [Flagellimonas okinawensis]|uniref:Porin n=1 Tax=Flagellimonas okinawensis TaxID=3031324 RepID=A0ABT5XT79_9FLAO|nr:putative porin [[Muricauda] okinawensis]MDF0709087.1 putative porin [[Muricauda] okinawensis]
MRIILFTLFIFFGHSVMAQQDSLPPTKQVDSLQLNKKDSLQVKSKDAIKKDSVKTKIKGEKPGKLSVKAKDSVSIKDYKIISYERDTTYLDTTLTIKKEYKYNYLRRDDFELMPFANMGQPYNELGKSFSSGSYYPKIGAAAKHPGYFEKEDIDYYNVPTPVTELMFKTSFEQGQYLDALLTFNVSKRLNASVAYNGFRSLGKYRYEEAQDGKFRVTFNYQSENERYLLRGHIAAQEMQSEENGGLQDRSQFEDDLPDFQDRAKIDLLYTNANNRILGKRYYLDHQYRLVRHKKDSTDNDPTTLALGHEFSYESKLYDFEQSNGNASLGSDPFLTPIEDRARLKTMLNRGFVEFSNRTLGKLSGNVSLYNYNYYFNSILITEAGTIQNKLQGDEISVGGAYVNNFGPLYLKGNVNYTIVGDLTGNNFDAMARYKLNDNNSVTGAIHISSRMPDFNYLLYQSDYRNFNWQNNAAFEKVNTQSIKFAFDSKNFGLLEAEYSALDNYTYFASTATEDQIVSGLENAFVRPFQESGTINHLKVKYQKELKWRKWALMNTVMYQNVTQDNQVLNLPEVVTRNSLYFSSDVFKKAMFLQTGVTFKYFTSYNMNAYNPLLGEFYIQNNEELGGYPLLDFFINAKVKQTRIYLKAEHLNSLFSEPNYYAAPNYPYRDFVIRFGLVWNFFS